MDFQFTRVLIIEIEVCIAVSGIHTLRLISDKKVYCYSSVDKGQAEPVEADCLTKELLDTNRCYLLDCGLEVFVWMGRSTALDERKSASGAAEVIF